MRRDTRSWAVMVIAGSVLAELTDEFNQEPNSDRDYWIADQLAAVVHTLARPGPWGQLLALTDDDRHGFIAWWADSIDAAKADGASVTIWVDNLFQRACDEGLVKT
jgi:hypothetical protein